jgi:hypothetical protein
VKQVLFALVLGAVAPVYAGDLIFFDGFEAVLHPVPGSVIFNEIMSNPTAVADNVGEWFELNNVSAQAVDVGGCIVSNGANQSTLPAHNLVAGSVAVVARSTDEIVNGGVAAFAAFPFGLGASGLLSLACDDRLIDETTWADETAGKSRSLDPARANALDNDNVANWCFATVLYNAVDNGSPGSTNEACPTIGGGGTTPVAGELSITEIMPDPAVLLDTDAEWVELRNMAAGARDLAGCVLNNGTTDSAAFPSVAIEPGNYALAGHTANPGSNGGLAIDATFAFSLLNSNGTLAVKCAGVVIDTIAWVSSTSGRSLQRDPVTPATICVAPAGVPEYTASNVGTPKADNVACP